MGHSVSGMRNYGYDGSLGWGVWDRLEGGLWRAGLAKMARDHVLWSREACLFSHECISVSRRYGLNVYVLALTSVSECQGQGDANTGPSNSGCPLARGLELSYRWTLPYLAHVLQSITRAAASAHYRIIHVQLPGLPGFLTNNTGTTKNPNIKH